MKYFSLKVVLSRWIVTSHRSPTTEGCTVGYLPYVTVPRAEDTTYLYQNVRQNPSGFQMEASCRIHNAVEHFIRREKQSSVSYNC